MFDARPYLKDLARGRHGARDLTREQARTLFEAAFAGEVAEVALGALLTALRVKGESLAELQGMLDALQPHVRPIELPRHRAIPVLLPSYNGARKLANLVPLLALLLAREEVPVLLHGLPAEPSRVGTFEILERLGHAPAPGIAEAEARLESHRLAVLDVHRLSPDLARLLDVRAVTGVRNSAHTLAKLLLPGGAGPASACRLIAVTHPDFLQLMHDYFVESPGNAFLMRGVEGEAVVRLHAPQPIEEVRADGPGVEHLIGDCDVSYALPSREAEPTAQWTRDVLEGRVAPPAALARQVALIAEHCRAAAAEGRPTLKLVKG
ncbi:MAG TPA: DNA-binding protein YbiB [Usitatibacter sp.]|nr:DNA-binding protein YbiB [Usitatibacter sp.]